MVLIKAIMDQLDIDLTEFLDNEAIVYYDEKESCTIVKYEDLLKQIIKIGLVLDQENLSRNEASVIGILCTKSPASVAVASAILEAGFGFCNLSSENISNNELDDFGIKYFFSDFQCASIYNCRNSFDLFGKTIRLYKTTSQHPAKLFDDKGDILSRICYICCTSGSTGKRKIVRVPFKCIKPNVVSLQKIFNLRNDVIFASAPCTFDVFILDVFLALYSGSTLLILSDNLRYSKKAIELLSNTVTFMQITPSLFVNYGLEIIQTKILHEKSSLR